MSSNTIQSHTSEQINKRKFLPWTNRLCGGPNIHGTSLCPADIDGQKKCYCSPPPDQNYVLCYNLASMVYENGLHICDKDVGTAWAILASKFCMIPYIATYDPIQGPAAKKSFNGIVRKARVMLANRTDMASFTSYELLMKDIIDDIDIFLKQKSEMMQQRMTFEAEKLAAMQMAMVDQVSSNSETTFDNNKASDQLGDLGDEQPIRARSSIFHKSRMSGSLLSTFGDSLTKRLRSNSSDELANDRSKRVSTDDDLKLRELEVREREVAIEESKLAFERSKWEHEIKFRDEALASQAHQIELQNKVILALIDRLDGA